MSLCERCQAEIAKVELPAADWIDPEGHRIGGKYLSGSQWKVFCILWRRFGMIVSVESFMTLLYGHRADPPADKIIDVLICKLRKSIEATPCEIVTCWGQGYSLRRCRPEGRAQGRERYFRGAN